MVLVGLMGSGKTTVGRRLAARLERDFIDADDALAEITDRTIAEIFETDGEDGVPRHRGRRARGAARAPPADRDRQRWRGGAAPPRTVRRLREPEVTVVWLDASPAFLASRVEQQAAPAPPRQGEPTRDVLARLHAERAPLYAEVADIVVDVEPFHRDEEKPKKALAERIEPTSSAITRPPECCRRVERDHRRGVARRPQLPRARRVPVCARELAAVLPPTARRVAVVTQAGIPFDVDPGREHQRFEIGRRRRRQDPRARSAPCARAGPSGA